MQKKRKMMVMIVKRLIKLSGKFIIANFLKKLGYEKIQSPTRNISSWIREDGMYVERETHNRITEIFVYFNGGFLGSFIIRENGIEIEKNIEDLKEFLTDKK